LFLTLFNNKSVKELFISKAKEEKTPRRPFGIKLIALLSFVSGFSYFIFVFQKFFIRMPILGNISLSGNALKAYCLILTVVYIYIGIGLLRLQRTAWLAAIFFKILIILQGVTIIFTISEKTLQQIYSSFGAGNFSMALSDYRIMGICGLTIPAAILIYLILKRELFLHSPQHQGTI
jgi:hypothetical protein